MDGVLGVCEVLFFLPDVQTAKEWYLELLGRKPYFDDENYCAFDLAGTTVGVHPIDEKTNSSIRSEMRGV